MDTDVIIIGGGLAGLTAAIDLRTRGWSVGLIEKYQYPFHRVCGEYISAEVLPYWAELGIDPYSWGALRLHKLNFSIPSGQHAQLTLPLGGFSISRYAIDFQLYKLAEKLGVVCWLNSTATKLTFENNYFTITLKDGRTRSAKQVLSAFGKRSQLDRSWGRPFFKQPAPFVAVKYHAELAFPEDEVGLHLFEKGYCGISQVETGAVNICLLTRTDHLKQHGNIQELMADIMHRNPYLGEMLQDAHSIFEQPLSISNVSFLPKSAIEHHTLVIGDAAGLIPPLCGNGMAMAITSAQIAAQEVGEFLSGNIARWEMEQRYMRQWNRMFQQRLWVGRRLQRLLMTQWFAQTAVWAMKQSPGLARAVIRQTHG